MTTWEGRGPDMLLRLLTERLTQRGGTLILGARAEALLMRDHRCSGVAATVDGLSRTFAASAVVIADGGFQANLDMLKRHIAPSPHRLRQRNAGTGTGDGICMAEAAGAAVTPLAGFYGGILSRDAMTNPALWPYPVLDSLAVSGIVVNQSGLRFADEGNGGVFIANAIAAQADPLSTLVICDAAIWEQSCVADVSSPNPKLARLGGTIYSAATIPELALAANLPPDALTASVENHNRACASKSGASLDPPRSARRHPPSPIDRPPFMAIPACAGITFTMGGIKIDGNARVIDTDGRIMTGLYAAGSTTGGTGGSKSWLRQRPCQGGRIRQAGR